MSNVRPDPVRRGLRLTALKIAPYRVVCAQEIRAIREIAHKAFLALRPRIRELTDLDNLPAIEQPPRQYE